MKSRAFTWLKGLSISGKVVLAASAIAVIGIVGASADSPPITTKTVTEDQAITFTSNYQDDESLLVNQTKVLTPGVDGEKKVAYKVTYKGVEEIKREKLSETTLKEPTAALVARGVKSVTTETTTEVVAYTTITKSDSTLAKGTSKTTTAGANGVRTITYEVTKIRGKEVSRAQVKSEVTSQPVSEVVAVGTKSAASRSSSSSSSCDSNYSGGCVPISSDVDCGGGTGNGPAYFYGTARVVGYDIYDLDRDNDGIACE